jgi:UDP-glucose 4-epimerase
MLAAGVRRLIYASSAAVYGNPTVSPVHENITPDPISPYGRTKLVGEDLVRAVGEAHGLSWLTFRYFNAVGTDLTSVVDRRTTGLFPRISEALHAGGVVEVAGGDHPTPDGSCVRDFVHVGDIADLHRIAVERLLVRPCGEVYNIGTGVGYSVLDVLQRVADVTGIPVQHRIGPPRSGDPAQMVADVHRVTKDLGWAAQRGLDEIVRSLYMGYSSGNSPDGATAGVG